MKRTGLGSVAVSTLPLAIIAGCATPGTDLVQSAAVEAYQSLVTALAQATMLRDDVLLTARQAFAAAREGYRRGKFSYLDVLDAQRTFFAARSRHIAVLADYHEARADVERLIGQGLDSIETPPRSTQKGTAT